MTTAYAANFIKNPKRIKLRVDRTLYSSQNIRLNAKWRDHTSIHLLKTHHFANLPHKMTHGKETLRQEALRHRGRMHYDIEDSDNVLKHFLNTFELKAGQVVALYWPKDHEFDTHPIMEAVLEIGCICALPCVNKKSRVLKFARWDTSSEMVSGAFDILEPQEKSYVTPDIVIVPLLAFDRRGHRLGYGGGYYDATLNALRANQQITAIGLAYAQQACLFNLPVEDHDEPMNWVITPQGAQSFGD